MSDWKDSLKNHFDSSKEQEQRNKESQQKQDMEKKEFLEKVITPAYDEIRKELAKYNRKIDIDKALLKVFIYKESQICGKAEFSYEIVLKIINKQIIPFEKIEFWDKSKNAYTIDVVTPIKTEQGLSEDKYYSITKITKEELIEHIIFKYTYFTRS